MQGQAPPEILVVDLGEDLLALLGDELPGIRNALAGPAQLGDQVAGVDLLYPGLLPAPTGQGICQFVGDQAPGIGPMDLTPELGPGGVLVVAANP